MATPAKLTVNTVEKVGTREKRTTQYAKGLKSGLIRGTVEKLVNPIADAVSDRVQPMMNGVHSGLEMAAPVTKILMRAATRMAIAEIIEVSGPAMAKVPGLGMSREDGVAKCQALARWLRNDAAEMLGTNLVEAAAEFVPMFAMAFKDLDVASMLDAVSEQEEQVHEQAGATA